MVEYLISNPSFLSWCTPLHFSGTILEPGWRDKNTHWSASTRSPLTHEGTDSHHGYSTVFQWETLGPGIHIDVSRPVCSIYKGVWADGLCQLASMWISGSRVSQQNIIWEERDRGGGDRHSKTSRKLTKGVCVCVWCTFHHCSPLQPVLYYYPQWHTVQTHRVFIRLYKPGFRLTAMETSALKKWE